MSRHPIHRVKVLDEGMKYEAVMIAPEDATFLGSREFRTEEIARIYDVPLILLRLHAKADEADEKGAA